MLDLEVEVTNYGRAFIRVDGTSETYTYDRSEGFRIGRGTNVAMWMQGARSIDVFNWKETYPFPALQEKLERIGKLDSFKRDVSVVIDPIHSVELRKRSLARVARMIADQRYAADVRSIDWSNELLPAIPTWDLIPKDVPVTKIFDGVKAIVERV